MNEPLIGLAQLMRRAFAGESLEPVACELQRRIDLNPDDAHALLDLSTLCQLGGAPAVALEYQARALALRQHYRLQVSPDRNPLRVLAIASRGLIMDNMPVEFLLEHRSVQLDVLYVGEGIAAPRQIPDHAIAIIAICESDANQPLLSALGPIAEHWPRPIINAPARISRLSRESLGETIEDITGLKLVNSERVNCCDLRSYGYFDRPVHPQDLPGDWIIRPVGTHAGHGLERIKNSRELEGYLTKNVADQYFVAPFINYQSDDGKYRKYRIALIAGVSYPVHMAISQHWMVHYLNADMLNNAENRQEEAAFMRDYRRAFGRRHNNALQHIAEGVGLDYVVLDCAETPEGELLLFEADNGAVVHSLDSVELFPYKVPAMENVFNAMRRMLWSRVHNVGHAQAA